MKPEELRAACQERVEKGVDHIYLTVPLKKYPQGESIRLAGRAGPLGRLCIVKEDGEHGSKTLSAAAIWRPKAILAWMDRESL